MISWVSKLDLIHAFPQHSFGVDVRVLFECPNCRGKLFDELLRDFLIEHKPDTDLILVLIVDNIFLFIPSTCREGFFFSSLSERCKDYSSKASTMSF